MNGLNKWKVALYLAAIFLAGGVSGWVVAAKTAKQRAFTPPDRDEIAASLRTCMHKRLQLTSDQKKKVDSIIERSSAELQSIHRRNLGLIRQALSNRNTQLSAVLSPEQQQLFAQIEKERKESFRGTGTWRSRPRGHDKGDGSKERRERSRDKSTTNVPGDFQIQSNSFKSTL
jgi:Spy/CpxP family protein refolding chaperone